MDYQLVFSPHLDITPAEFVAAWNADPDTHQIANAHLAPGAQRSYNDPLVEAAWLLLSTIGIGIVTNALYDLLKGAIAKKHPHKRVKITKLDTPDGKHLLVFEEEEGL